METLKVFITLLALINPFGAIPMFLSLTAGQSARERHSTINTAAIATAIVVGAAAQLLFFNVLGGATGMLVFPFAALALALADREREARA